MRDTNTKRIAATTASATLACCLLAVPAAMPASALGADTGEAIGDTAVASCELPVSRQLTVYANGKKVGKAGYLKVGRKGRTARMVPLKATCEKLGAKVKKTRSAKELVVDTGDMHTRIERGVNSYTFVTSIALYIGMSAPTRLASAPVVRKGVWYVPANMFRGLYGNAKGAVRHKGNKVWITAK